MTWLQLAYQYLVGGAFFLTTMLLCFQSDAGPQPLSKTDRATVRYLVIGFFAYLLVNIAWIILAAD